MNMRYLVGLVLWLGCLAGPAHAQSPAAPLPFKSFHLKATISAAGMGAMPSEMWFRAPDSFRSVTQVMNRPMVTIMAGQDVFTYQEGAGTGMKLNRAALQAQAKQADLSDLVRKAFDWKSRGRKIGSEPVNGRPCDIYEFNEGVNGQAVKGKVWLWTANGFPLRSVTQVGSVATEMTVSEIQTDLPLADALFQPPPGVQFQDLGALMQNLPNLDQLKKQFGAPQQ